MSLLHISLSISTTPPQNLSFSRSVTNPDPLFLRTKLSQLSLRNPHETKPIRMGGGPRTYPGGVSKWTWKRMQSKKAKQLLKARLCRERQIYEMRKRAELKAAVAELEKPWEVVERAPSLFSVRADEQLKVLADRFQRPGGFDMWSEKDGPQLFEPIDEVPSARFFPKGVVHSLKPYQPLSSSDDDDDDDDDGELGLQKTGYNRNSRRNSMRKFKNTSTMSDIEDEGKELSSSGDSSDMENLNSMGLSRINSGSKNGNGNGKLRKNGNRRSSGSLNSREISVAASERRGKTPLMSGRNRQFRRSGSGGGGGGGGLEKSKELNSEVFDMNFQQDGTYKF